MIVHFYAPSHMREFLLMNPHCHHQQEPTSRHRLRWVWSIITAIIFSALWPGFSSAEMSLPASADVRVLIDISGSMKKNDPNNLRRPALNLITELLPEGDVAGVWTFGKFVNELVRHQPVNEQWRRLAREKANEINSVALFTNIGAVLEKASEDLVAGQDYSNTHFILLTDGVVDISQTAAENVAERERIQTEVIKRFKGLKAKIHTVALSKNADQVILKKLSVETDGVAALAETSEELSRVFLQALERASPSEEVPIEDNGFTVDSSVEEFTALIFRAQGAGATGLTEPTGKQFSANEFPQHVKWFQQPGYDLITVKQPLEGEWKLDAELAEGSKVKVVSNLRLVFDPLPGNFYAGDQLEIRAGFFEDGQQVLAPTFLDIVTMNVTITTEDGKSGTKEISKPGEPPRDGIFREKITRLKKVGRYQVMVEADGRTFKRQSRQLIQLNPPMGAELEATGTGSDTRYRVLVNALSPNINIPDTALVAKIKAPDGGNLIKSVPFNVETDRWELAIEPSKGDGIYQLSLRVDGVTLNGSQFRFEPDLITAEFPRQEASPNEFRSLIDAEQTAVMNDVLAEEANIQAMPTEQPSLADNNEVKPQEEGDSPQEESGLSTMLMIAIGGGVSLLAILGGLGIWLFKRKKTEDNLIKERTSKKELSNEDGLDAEPDLEDEIEQLEQAPVPEEPEPPAQDDTDEMAFALDDNEISDDLDIPDIEPAPEPEPGPAAEAEEPIPAMEAEEPEPEEDDDEFNLEDFDISDTDDLPPPEEDDKKT